jgi:hypothetical protein
MNGPISRKEFFSGVTRSMIAASAGAAAMSVITAVDSSAAVPTWPWPYKKLDREDLRKRAHKDYYEGGCCYGAFNALVGALAAQVGEPYTLMPTQMMYFGGGGAAGWGTLCGALNGAAALISIVTSRTAASSIINELFGWYTKAIFPSDLSNDYAQHGMFLLNKVAAPLKQTISGSPLCHASVSGWCTEAGFKASAPERAERCARLTGDTAARTVELLNDYFDGQFRATFIPADSVTGCMSCHSSAVGNVQSTVKMDCQQCHQEDWGHNF